MKYIVCETPGTFLLKDKKEPQLAKGQAKLKIHKVGICGTDLHAYQGNQAFFSYPRILGHELSAEVVEIDSDESEIKAGDKVVIIPYISCNQCIACKAGKTNCCTNIEVLGIHTDGGMQEHIVVPIRLLIPAPKLSNDEMCIVEPLAIGAHAIKRANIQQNETVVVVGCGPIGIGIIKLAQLAGAEVIAIDANQHRLDYAKNKIGADHVVLANKDSIDQVSALTNGDLATAVFDATGNKAALESGINYMSHGGRYILVGLSKGELQFEHPAIHAKETTLLCSRNATVEDFINIIKVLEENKFPTDSFITHATHFTQMAAEFEEWLDPANGVIKAVVNFN